MQAMLSICHILRQRDVFNARMGFYANAFNINIFDAHARNFIRELNIANGLDPSQTILREVAGLQVCWSDGPTCVAFLPESLLGNPEHERMS